MHALREKNNVANATRLNHETEAPKRKQHSSSEEVFRDIVRGLYDGRYVPGQRLVEADLTRDYGVSRGTARDALRQLGNEGLVSIDLHRGARIRRLSRKEMADILGLVEVLTGYSCRLCAERSSDEGFKTAFSGMYDDLMSHEDQTDSIAFVRARNRYFRGLVELSGNDELQRLMPTLHLHLIRVQVKSFEVENQMIRFEDYRRMGDAILQGEASRAESAGRRHVQKFAAVIASLPDHRFRS